MLGSRENIASTKGAAANRHRTDTVCLWLGASQLHTISDFVDGDAIAVEVANHRSENSRQYFQLSFGNANLLEYLAAYVAYRKEAPPPDILILGLTFDDVREPGIRASLRPELSPDLIDLGGEGLQLLDAAIRSQVDDREEAKTPVVRTAVESTPQAKLEEVLLNQLDLLWPPYRHRDKLRSRIDLLIREGVVRILLGKERRTSMSISEADVDVNLIALESLAKLAKSDGVRCLFYNAPLLKSDLFSYYVPQEYEQFICKLNAVAARYKVSNRDFRDLVPSEFFGLTNSGLPDYFHFNNQGHQILGREIDDWVQEVVD